MKYYTIEDCRRNSKIMHANDGYYLKTQSLTCIVHGCSVTASM